MARWIVLAGSGFRYDYVTEVNAPNWRDARKAALAFFGGDYRSRDFKVRRAA